MEQILMRSLCVIFYTLLFKHHLPLSKSFCPLFGECKTRATDNHQKCTEIFDCRLKPTPRSFEPLRVI